MGDTFGVQPQADVVLWQSGATSVAQVEPPSGRVSLVLSDGAPIRVELDGGRTVCASSFVVGMFDRPARTLAQGPCWGVQVDLDPSVAYSLTDGLVAELTNRVVPLHILGCIDSARVLERVAAASAPKDAADAIGAEIGGAIAGRPVLTPQVKAAWQLIRARPTMPIATVATAVGWNRSHLAERFHAEIGLPPKSVARVLRFRQAVGLLRKATALSAVAAATGYADQSHMTREFRALSGSTPAAYGSTVAVDPTSVQD